MPRTASDKIINRIKSYFEKHRGEILAPASIAKETKTFYYSTGRACEMLAESGFIRQLKSKEGTFYIMDTLPG